MKASFVVNLRSETIAGSFRRKLRPPGYLAPPSQLTATLRAAARSVRRSGRLLVVDNGQFDEIGRIVRSLEGDVLTLKAGLVTTGGSASIRVNLSTELRDQVDRLAAQVAAAGSQARGMLLEEQLGLRPTAVIGAEDIVPATWLRVGLDAPLLNRARRMLRRRNEKVAAIGARIAEQVRREVPRVRYHPVASALDYDTAWDAGRAFARTGLTAAAMGFGAFMADDRYAKSVTVHGRRIPLARNLPMRYLRSALVARGFWDGWREETGRVPRAFHFLGLGAPIIMGVVSVAAGRTPVLTFDATSPIRDAVEGMLYWARPTYLKVRTRRAALRLSRKEWDRWRCACPFCRAFIHAHPFDYARGHAWAEAAGAPATVTGAELAPGGPLFEAYPLLSEPAPGTLRTEVNLARAGHNHWVVVKIMNDLQRHGRTRIGLERHVGEVVESYGRATSAAEFAEAVRTAFAIATGSEHVTR